MLVSDSGNHRVRVIDIGAGIVTTLVGTGSAGGTDGSLDQASFFNPRALAIDPSGWLIIGETGSRRLRRLQLDLASGQRQIVTLAGSAGGSGLGTARAPSLASIPFSTLRWEATLQFTCPIRPTTRFASCPASTPPRSSGQM